MLARRARRAEHRHRRAEPRERVEPARELPGDVVHPLRRRRRAPPAARRRATAAAPRRRSALRVAGRRLLHAVKRYAWRRPPAPGGPPPASRRRLRRSLDATHRPGDRLHRAPLRRARATCASTSHAHDGRRGGAAGARPRARGRGRRARAAPVDRAAPRRGARGARQRRRPRRDACPTSDDSLGSSPQPGRTRVHRRGERLLVPAGDARPGDRALLPSRRARGDRAAAGPRDGAGGHAPTAAWTIRGQRTRWASCSADGRMSFNWRLLLAPERVLEYVVWHEVCHLRGARPLAPLLGAAASALARLPRGSRVAARATAATLVL